MNRDEVIRMFSSKMIIKVSEVQKYDESKKEIFDELIESNCIELVELETMTEPSVGKVKYDKEKVYRVSSYMNFSIIT